MHVNEHVTTNKSKVKYFIIYLYLYILVSDYVEFARRDIGDVAILVTWFVVDLIWFILGQ